MRKICFLSTFPPTKCGIANFTKDLTTSINDTKLVNVEIIAISDLVDNYIYNNKVKLVINKFDIDEYFNTAEYINKHYDILCLQHEFGLFGGEDGDFLLPFLKKIKIPIITTFHTILPKPEKYKKTIKNILAEIANLSTFIVGMSEQSGKYLKNVYDCADSKINIIDHGVPSFDFNNESEYKIKIGLESDKKMLLMSGLIGSGKGIEFVIEAMKTITISYPEARFYIVGQTHPEVIKKNKGEDLYRMFLEEKIKKLELENSIIFINKYLELDNLLNYFKATDIYLTPHLDAQQATSGTLAYAIGAGKVCISTPFEYATNMLNNHNGILIPFKNSQAISDSVIKVFSDKVLFEKYKKNAYSLGKEMRWPVVAKKYISLFNRIDT
jgi:glycosyltransferase involved in cell wall biosynthesis